MKTVTWFHTGAPTASRVTAVCGRVLPRRVFLSGRPFRESATSRSPELDPVHETLDADERREALRACKGMMLRQEITSSTSMPRRRAARQVRSGCSPPPPAQLHRPAPAAARPTSTRCSSSPRARPSPTTTTSPSRRGARSARPAHHAHNLRFARRAGQPPAGGRRRLSADRQRQPTPGLPADQGRDALVARSRPRCTSLTPRPATPMTKLPAGAVRHHSAACRAVRRPHLRADRLADLALRRHRRAARHAVRDGIYPPAADGRGDRTGLPRAPVPVDYQQPHAGARPASALST